MSLTTSLIETFVTEDGFNGMIRSCHNLDMLDQMLDIKLEFIKKNAHQKAVLPLDNVLNNIDRENLNKACSVLEKLLVVQSDDTELQHLQYHINNYISEINTNEKDKLNIAFNLIISLLTAYSGNSKLELALDKLFATLLKCEDKKEDKKLWHTFVVRILLKYTQNFDKKYLYKVVESTVKARRLDILCSFINFVLSEDLKYEIALLTNSEDFWELMGNGLVAQENFLKKQAIYVLKCLTDFTFDTSSLYNESEFIKLKSISIEKTKKAWKTYFLLLDIAQEDQIHLVEPSLILLPTITCLHPFWVTKMYGILFSHSQVDIVSSAVNSILTSDWLNDVQNFKSFAEHLIGAFTRVSYRNYCTKISPLISSFVQNCNEQIFLRLLTASCDVIWSPFITWAFYRSVFYNCPKFKIPLYLSKDILNHLHLLPEEHIREACALVFLKYLSKNMDHYTLNDLLSIYRIIDKSYSSLDEKIFKYFQPIIISHQGSILNEVQSWQNLKQMSACDLENLIKWAKLFPIKVDYPNEEIQNACSSMECVKITDKICLLREVCSNEQIVEYLVRRLYNVDDTTNIRDIENIVQYICNKLKKSESSVLAEKFGTKVNGILLADTKKDMVKVQIAFEIVIAFSCVFNHVDILRIWLETYKVQDRNITENVRQKILRLYLEKNEQGQYKNNTEELLEIINCTLEMQNYQAFLYILSDIISKSIYYNLFEDICCITNKIVDGIYQHTNGLKCAVSSKSLENSISSFLYNIFKFSKNHNGSEQLLLKVAEKFSSLSDSFSFIDSLLTNNIYWWVLEKSHKGEIFVDTVIKILNRNKYLCKDQK